MKLTERGNPLLRFIDKFVGIPLVLFLGALHKKNPFPRKIKKIGLLKTAAIGDTVLLTAIIKDLKTLLSAEIVLFTGKNNFEMGEIIARQYGIKVVKLPTMNLIKTIKIVRQYDFDLWFDFGQWPRYDALISHFSKSRFKVGFKTPGQYKHYVFDEVAEHSKNVHEIENFRRLLSKAGIEGNHYPEIISDKVPTQKNIIVHMFPGGYKSYLKEWPAEYWIKVINFLTSKGYTVTLTGGKEDRERAESIRNLCKDRDKVFVSAGIDGLEEVVHKLRQSELVVSVNTGIMHLASALGCKIVALHGPTSSLRWGPLGKNSISIQSPLSCSPCLNLGFEYGCNENKCMRAITVDSVISSIKKLCRGCND